MLGPTPLVSFVMPVFNRAKVLERALFDIERERLENYPDLELVIIDGGSTDGTIELLRRHSQQIQYWISERDSGASEAFNKGIRAANGAIIRYIACDDVLVPGHTRGMVECLLGHPELHVLGALARSYHVALDGTRRLNRSATEGGELSLKDLIQWCDGPKFSPIETWFFRREVFDRVGGLDMRYRICPDLDLAFRIVKSGLRFNIQPACILEKCYYEDGSNLVANSPRLVRERRQVVRRHVGCTLAGLCFLYSYPVSLPLRLAHWPSATFWRCWLATVKCVQYRAPSAYAFAQRALSRKTRA